jgi:GTPase SAR1 family protein
MVVATEKAVRCAVVGDGFVGKSSLVQKFVHGQFNPEYVATLKDEYTTKVSSNGDVYRLHVTDIAGEVRTLHIFLSFRRNLHIDLMYFSMF